MTLVLLAPLIAALAIVAAAAGLRAQQRRQRSLLGHVMQPALASASGEVMPSLLFFTGETCTICHTAQRPALETLAAQLGDRVSIREIDIAREPELARRYRVMSLPTTVVLDAGAQVTAINTGFASVERLRSQLEPLAVAPVAAA